MSSPSLTYITITCLPSNRKLVVPKGSNVFHALRDANIPIAHACLGEGICAQCVVDIQPTQHLTPESNLEKKRKKDNRIDASLRMSCLCRAQGDITVSASYW